MNWFKLIKIYSIAKDIFDMIMDLGNEIDKEALSDAFDAVIDTLQAVVKKLDPEDEYGIMDKLDWLEEKWGDPSD